MDLTLCLGNYQIKLCIMKFENHILELPLFFLITPRIIVREIPFVQVNVGVVVPFQFDLYTQDVGYFMYDWGDPI